MQHYNRSSLGFISQRASCNATDWKWDRPNADSIKPILARSQPATVGPRCSYTGISVSHGYNFRYKSIIHEKKIKWRWGRNCHNTATVWAVPVAASGAASDVRKPPALAPLHWEFEMYISLSLIAVTNKTVDNGALSWIQGWESKIWYWTRILVYCGLQYLAISGAGPCWQDLV